MPRWADMHYVYLMSSRKKSWAPRGTKLYRKVGITRDVEHRKKLLSQGGDILYEIVKVWHMPDDAVLVEWVARKLLKRDGNFGEEYMVASVEECLECIDEAIKLVAANDYSRWPKKQWSNSVRKRMGLKAWNQYGEI